MIRGGCGEDEDDHANCTAWNRRVPIGRDVNLSLVGGLQPLGDFDKVILAFYCSWTHSIYDFPVVHTVCLVYTWKLSQ